MAQLYIATTGNDSTGAGTIGNPWLTVNKVVTSASTGDTINIAAGAYTWPTESTSTKSLTFIGSALSNNLPTVTLTGVNGVHWSIGAGITWTISNVTFTQSAHTSTQQPMFNDAGGATTATFSFNNCWFKNLGWTTASLNIGIFDPGAANESMTFTFTSCLFTDAQIDTGTTSNSALFGNAGGVSTTSVFNLTNCTLYQSVANNAKFYQSGGGGTFAGAIKNCVFYAVNAWTLTAGTVTWSYNDYFNVTNEGGTGSITGDPLFQDVANSNFNLRPTSPCIDTGTN